MGLALLAACGGSGGSKPTPLPTSARSPVGAGTAVTGAPAPGSSAPAAGPTRDATEQATIDRFALLEGYVLTAADTPSGFRVRSDQPATKDDIVTAEIGIVKLATYLKNSDLDGAWTSLYTRDQPQTALSFIVFRFGSPAGASGMVDLLAGIAATDYPAAVTIDHPLADTIGDRSTLTRYRITGGRSVELTWSRGSLAGQVILRNTGDVEAPADVETVVNLAKLQDARMASAR